MIVHAVLLMLVHQLLSEPLHRCFKCFIPHSLALDFAMTLNFGLKIKQSEPFYLNVSLLHVPG